MTPKITDSVRRRKKNESATTQRFLPVAEIRNNTILLKNGGIRAVIQVEALNFNLKSELEQQAIISGYGSFVNTLSFPLQIIIRSSKTNVDEYIDRVKAIGNKQENALLKNQTLTYAAFLQKLIEMADIMQKRFYVVVPVDHSVRHKTVIEQFFDWIHPDDAASKVSARNHEFTHGHVQLNERVELISSGLSNIGLHCKRLPTRDLIALMYQTYNPKTSQTQKMPADMEQLHMEKTAL